MSAENAPLLFPPSAEPSLIAPSPHVIYNRYAVTPLDSSYYQSCIFWARAAEIATLSILVIIGTIGVIFLYMHGWEISALLCQLVIMKIGYECHNWCTNTLINQKFARWEAVSHIFETSVENSNEPIEIRRLGAHYRWYEENMASQMENMNTLLPEIRTPQQPPPNVLIEKIENLIRIEQNLAISKVYAAYYDLLIKDHKQKIQTPLSGLPDTRELIDICRINPLDRLYEYAQAHFVQMYSPQYNPFLQVGDVYLTAAGVIRLEINDLSYLLQNRALPLPPPLAAQLSDLEA